MLAAVSLAAAVSAAVVVSPQPAQAWTAIEKGWRVAYYAKLQIGDPYVFGAAGPHSFDCSGLVKYSYAKAIGKWVPHNADQIARMGYRVASMHVRPGDVAYWVDNTGYAYHVGVVARTGPIYVVDAPYAGRDVTMRRPWSGVRYRRI